MKENEQKKWRNTGHVIHRFIKDLANRLLEIIETKSSLMFTTKELEYLIYYISGKAASDFMASTLVGKILDELQRRKEKLNIGLRLHLINPSR